MKREQEIKNLIKIIDRPQSDFIYLRGRRRVGKSWILTELCRKKKDVFYFMGGKDARDSVNKAKFAEAWSQFTNNTELLELRRTSLSWTKIFNHITQHLQTSKRKTTLIFDEIQWLAKSGVGFCSLIKEYWLTWEKFKTVKIIICGSSNKFFHDQTGGEEQLLRGLRTHSDIWIKPFSLAAIREEKFPLWKLEEVAMLYMMIGGIPYYLEQIDPAKGFIQAINRSLFCSETLFLEEIDEILRIEFNKTSVHTAKSILRSLGLTGADQKTICEKSSLSKSTVFDIIEKMLDYNIVFPKMPIHKTPTRGNVGLLYYAKDFFINFYFQVLDKYKERIIENEKALLFPYEILQSNKGFYIPNFSGSAYERLLQYAFESGPAQYPKLFEAFELTDTNFEIGSYWDSKCQLDLIVEHRKDRISRIIEVKWQTTEKVDYKALCKKLIEKPYVPPAHYSKKYFLFVTHKPNPKTAEACLKIGVQIFDLSVLF